MSGHLRKGTVLFRRTSVGWYLVYPFVPRVLTYTSLRQNDDDDDDTVIRICMQIFHFLLFLHCYKGLYANSSLFTLLYERTTITKYRIHNNAHKYYKSRLYMLIKMQSINDIEI